MHAQSGPLSTPPNIEYPGILETFEKLIQIDHQKIQKRTELLIKNGKVFTDSNSVNNLDLEPDFLNSIILHSNPGYLRLAATSKCHFYDAILTDLLRNADGKIKNVLMTYIDKDIRQSSLMSKKDFLNKVVNQECPETINNIKSFQIKTISETLKKIKFELPTGLESCKNIHQKWVTHPKTAFLCQIDEYIKDASNTEGDQKESEKRKTIAQILERKINNHQKDYLHNLCKNLDDEIIFCEEFLNISFWSKVASGQVDKMYAEDICRQLTKSLNPNESQYSFCLLKIKKEKDLCLYPSENNSGLRPQPDCDQISMALNFSSLKANYKDCPGNSDQMIATNVSRIISHFSPTHNLPSEGPCSSISAKNIFNFNKEYDNDENWNLQACYKDKSFEKEICYKTYFGDFKNDPNAYTSVIAKILKQTSGTDPSLNCEMVDNQTYNPFSLKYRSGCFIVFEKDKCNISSCSHKIFLNDRKIDFIKTRGPLSLSYFPSSITDERFSQNYMLTKDFKKKESNLNNISSLTNYFKNSKNGIVHGIGCAEDILPSFFKAEALNQCRPLPFIINGIIKENDKYMFVTRTSADSLQAPRLINWSSIFSGVKNYQNQHPLKQWSLYGLD